MQIKKLILISCLLSFIFSAMPIGVIIKSAGTIEFKKFSDGKKQVGLARGTTLFNNDEIKTGEDGFAILMYTDDKSQVKIQNNTELVIRGALEPGNIVKQINVTNGTIKADVKKQKGGDFTVVSPTSVAAVKGTDFWGVVNESAGDQFFGLSGSVEITNTITGETVEMLANTTAISLSDGSMSVAATEDGDLPEDQDPDAGDEGGESEIRIPFQDESGEQKELIIKFN